jgi:hypothetical protein
MKQLFFKAALACAFLAGPACVQSQTNGLVTPAAVMSEQQKASLEKHTKPILAALNLADAAQAAQVHDILAAHLQALSAWHAQHDGEIKPLWNEFNKARGKQNEADADAALAKLDGVYAALKPEHEKFLTQLATLLTPDQVETVKDVLTINKVRITFNAYGQIFHGLTDPQKDFILQHLKAAREEAIDGGAMTEKSLFFKKYKIQIEAYLTGQGYDVKQAYRDFVAKQKAAADARDAATAPDNKQ